MRAILEFNLPEESEEHEMALKGWRYKSQVEDIWTEVFRPRHKHGYNDPEINKLINSKNGQKIMEYLEQLYREIVND